MAALLAEVLGASNRVHLAWEPQANEVFAILERERAEEMRAAGARFNEWGVPQSFEGDVPKGEAIYRFVTSFATTADEVDRFGDLIA
jgi:threonine aldolase